MEEGRVEVASWLEETNVDRQNLQSKAEEEKRRRERGLDGLEAQREMGNAERQ